MKNMIVSEPTRHRQDATPDRESVGKPASLLIMAKRDADRDIGDRVERFPLSTPCGNERRRRGSGSGIWRFSTRPEYGAADAANRVHAAASESIEAQMRVSRMPRARVVQRNEESGKSSRFALLNCKMPAVHGCSRTSRFRSSCFCGRPRHSLAQAHQVSTC